MNEEIYPKFSPIYCSVKEVNRVLEKSGSSYFYKREDIDLNCYFLKLYTRQATTNRKQLVDFSMHENTHQLESKMCQDYDKYLGKKDDTHNTVPHKYDK